MKTEYEKMISGEFYQGFAPELVEMRTQTRFILQEYNNSRPDNEENRNKILQKLFKAPCNGTIIEPPFYADYGFNTELGKNVYMNFNCTILDCAKVKIGSNTFLGPSVQIYTPVHPLDAEERNSGMECGKEVTIGENCWIGGNVTILPGVTIGNNSVIGAGSVVAKGIPANSLAVGNPAKVIRTIQKK